MPTWPIDDLADPRLEPFRDIRNRNWTELSGRFVLEGPLLVRELLASDYQCESILLDRKFENHYRAMVPDDVELLLVEHEVVEQIVGYDFHRGVLACGERKPILQVREDFGDPPIKSEVLVATFGIQDPENLGGILRSCAGLGIDRVIIGPGTADPLARRVLRVSMGNALKLRLFRSKDLLADLRWMRETMGIESVAAALRADAEDLESLARNGPAVILFGNERNGLPEDLLSAADRSVQIAMAGGTDSLNVCVAAGIVLHYFCRLAR